MYTKLATAFIATCLSYQPMSSMAMEEEGSSKPSSSRVVELDPDLLNRSSSEDNTTMNGRGSNPTPADDTPKVNVKLEDGTAVIQIPSTNKDSTSFFTAPRALGFALGYAPTRYFGGNYLFAKGVSFQNYLIRKWNFKSKNVHYVPHVVRETIPVMAGALGFAIGSLFDEKAPSRSPKFAH